LKKACSAATEATPAQRRRVNTRFIEVNVK